MPAKYRISLGGLELIGLGLIADSNRRKEYPSKSDTILPRGHPDLPVEASGLGVPQTPRWTQACGAASICAREIRREKGRRVRIERMPSCPLFFRNCYFERNQDIVAI